MPEPGNDILALIRCSQDTRRTAIPTRRLLLMLMVTFAVATTACDRLDDDLFSPVTTEPTIETEAVTTSTEAEATTTTIFVPDLSVAAAGWSVSLRGVGPFQVGMTVQDAEFAAGTFLTEGEDDDPACSYYSFDPATGIADQIRFMVRANMIARIDFDGPLLKTISGVGVGSTSGDVRGTYGEAIVVSPGDSGETNHDYLTFIPSDGADLQFRLRFEAVDDVVTTYRIGKLPEVEWFDRCE